METLTKIVGGTFGLEFSLAGTQPSFIHPDSQYLLGARSALWKVFDALHPAAAWMPSYLCETMLYAAAAAGMRVRFYPINHQLGVEAVEWIAEVKPGDVVLFVDYFGFPGPVWMIEALRARGAWILEDGSQALLSAHVGQFSDFVVYSPRKFVGVPDGGILWNKSGLALTGELAAPPADWWLKAYGAALLRRDFDGDPAAGDRKWFELFQEKEIRMPIGNYAASALTIELLKSAIDWETVAAKRRENYLFLLEELRERAVFKELPEGVVPLGFPIVLPNRDEVRRALFAEHIYPPVHWEIEGHVPDCFAESHRLSREIMTLVCDQRYRPEDLQPTVQIVKEKMRL